MTMIALVSKPLSIFPEYKTRVWWLCLLVAILLMFSFGTMLVYATGIGGYFSEQLLGRSGVSDSSLVIGRSGVSNPSVDVGMSGIATIGSASDIYMDGAGTHATLHGNLATLNGFQSVEIYFEWGYDMAYGHSSVTQTVSSTGAFSSNIQGYDPGQTVYYRAVVEADGTNYSGSSSFLASSVSDGIIAGFNILNGLVVLAYIAMVLFAVIIIGKESTVVAVILMAVAIFVGEAFVVAIQEAIQALLGG